MKRATLYAYASRGLVRSEPSGRGKAKRYLRADLERVAARSDARAGHGAVAAGALRWGEPVLESGLTRIEPSAIYYRGRSAIELARVASFEQVAELLWTGELPDVAPSWSVASIGVDQASLAALVPERARLLARLEVGAAAFGAASAEESARDELERARRLLLRLGALLGGIASPVRAARALTTGSVARAILAGFDRPLEPEAVRAVETALILLADHELNASAFAVRVAASAGANLYACASAGFATLSGPFHGGACDRVEELEAETPRTSDAAKVLRPRLSRGEAVPGFGHTLYPAGDPRFAPAFDAAERLAPRAVGRLRALLDAGRDAGLAPPTVDFGLVAITRALDLPAGSAAALFGLGRAAGWVAHMGEQRAAGSLLRPRARYVGP